MLQPPSHLLEMASLRLPDSEEFDVERIHRTSVNGVLTTTRSPSLSSSSSSSSSASSSSSSSILSPSQLPPFYLANDIFIQTKDDLRDYLKNSLTDLVTSGTRNTMDDSLSGLFNSSTAGNIPVEHVPDRFYRHSIAMTAVYCIAYLFVFIVGLIGNSFVIAVVYRSPRMRTVTNFFIVNLAIADVLVIVFCLPATLVGNILVRKLNFYKFFFFLFIKIASVVFKHFEHFIILTLRLSGGQCLQEKKKIPWDINFLVCKQLIRSYCNIFFFSLGKKTLFLLFFFLQVNLMARENNFTVIIRAFFIPSIFIFFLFYFFR